MIDLHTHSTASDGSLTPPALIEKAIGIGLVALALTDHDTLDGVPPARARAEKSALRFIPGVEIEIECDTGEFHLLGLGLAGDTAPLREALSRIQVARRERNRRMVARLQEAGFPITMEEIEQAAGGDIVSRAHFAKVLVRRKLASSIDAVFRRLIGKGMPYYEPRACLPLPEATRLIREAGGHAVIAHPVSLRLRGPALRAFVAACAQQGVSGLEAWHPNHSLTDSRRIERLAGALGMIVTGGSDFHGDHIPGRKLGQSTAGREVPDRLAAPFLAGQSAANANGEAASLNPSEA